MVLAGSPSFPDSATGPAVIATRSATIEPNPPDYRRSYECSLRLSQVSAHRLRQGHGARSHQSAGPPKPDKRINICNLTPDCRTCNSPEASPDLSSRSWHAASQGRGRFVLLILF